MCVCGYSGKLYAFLYIGKFIGTHKIIPFTISLMEEKCIKVKGGGNKTHRS